MGVPVLTFSIRNIELRFTDKRQMHNYNKQKSRILKVKFIHNNRKVTELYRLWKQSTPIHESYVITSKTHFSIPHTMPTGSPMLRGA